MSVAEPLHLISLGAGVQSTAVALLAAHGRIGPMPAAAIFADTGDEPVAVQRHLEWLRSGVLPFPVLVTRRVFSISESLEQYALAHQSGDRLYGKQGSPPFFVREPGAKDDRSTDGMLSRQCTDNWKIDPIDGITQALVREHLGEKEARRAMRAGEPLVVQWLGISTDEASRMKPARKKWIQNRYPLAMELRMSRQDCLAWMEREGYPRPPRSACVYCPYKSASEWRALRDGDPADWAKAVKIDRMIRGGLAGMTRTREVYVHPSRVPLEDVDMSTPEDNGQLGLWPEECAGVCGV